METPELAGDLRTFEVVVTVPREDGGEPLVPYTLPPQVLGCWAADKVTASAVVPASRPSTAVAAVEVLVPDPATAAGAVVTASPVPAMAAYSAAPPGIL